MTGERGRRRPRWAALTGVAALLALALPGASTGAYLTATSTAAAAEAGTGSWCPLPDATQPNVYILSDLPSFTSAVDGVVTHMAIIPVVNAGGVAADDFAPVVDPSQAPPPDGSRSLGVRTWACSPTEVAVDGVVTVSAWRRDAASSAVLAWLPAASAGWSGQRLDPQQGWGLEMQRLHKWGSQPGPTDTASLTGQHRQQYSWVVSYPRKRTSVTNAPQCLRPSSCTLQTSPRPLRKDAFQGSDGTSTVPRNDVAYMAAKYWTGSGEGPGDWPADSAGAVPLPTVLLPYAGDPTPPSSGGAAPTATDGRQVQWVVVEWSGSKVPARALRLEVFLS